MFRFPAAATQAIIIEAITILRFSCRSYGFSPLVALPRSVPPPISVACICCISKLGSVSSRVPTAIGENGKIAWPCMCRTVGILPSRNACVEEPPLSRDPAIEEPSCRSRSTLSSRTFSWRNPPVEEPSRRGTLPSRNSLVEELSRRGTLSLRSPPVGTVLEMSAGTSPPLRYAHRREPAPVSKIRRAAGAARCARVVGARHRHAHLFERLAHPAGHARHARDAREGGAPA